LPRLIGAGLGLFSHLGVEAVHSNAIARRAGVGIGTFYAHFEDKHALLQEIERRTLAALQDARRAAVEAAGSDPEAQVESSVAAAVDFAGRHPAAYRVTFGRERVGRQRPVLRESTRPTAEGLRGLQARGRLDAELDPDLAARAWSATEVGTLLWWIDQPQRAPAASIVDTLVRMHPVRAARRGRG